MFAQKFQVISRSGLILAASASLVVLAGCATISNDGKIDRTYDQSKGEVKNHTDEFQAQKQSPSSPTFSVSDSSFFNPSPLDLAVDNARLHLPPQMFQQVNFKLRGTQNLTELLSKVTLTTGVQVEVNPDVYQATAGEVIGSGSNGQSAVSGGNSLAPPIPAANSASTTNSTQNRTGQQTQSQLARTLALNGFSFDGKFSDMMDFLSSRLNINWAWRTDHVELYAYETKLFKVNILPGTAKVDSSVASASSTDNLSSASTGGSGGGGGGNSSVISANSGNKVDLSAENDVWAELKAALTVVKSAGGKLAVLPATGVVAMTDTPAVLSQAKKIVDHYNESMARQVVFDVAVYSIELENQDNYGVSWSSTFQKIFGKLNISYSATGPLSGNLFTTTYTNPNPNGRFQSGNSVISALSTLGKTSLVTSASLMTDNGVPVPLQVAENVAYVQSVQNTVSSGTGGFSQSTITPGTVQDGFTINLTPRIDESGEVFLQCGINLSQIIQITTFTTPDNTSSVQLPDLNVRNFLERAHMHSGETLLLAGFKQINSKRTDQGTGDPSLWALGGSKINDHDEKQLILMITPYVLGN